MTRRRGLWLLAVAVLGVSSAAVLASWLLVADPDPRRTISLALWRCGGAAAVLVVTSLRTERISLTPRQVRRLSLSGVLMGVHFALFLGSLAFTSVASSTTLATMSPVVVALASIVWLREPPTRRTVIGMSITLVAAVALGATDLLAVTGLRALLGDAMALASAVMIAGTLVIGRAERGAIPAVQYSAIVFSVATITLALVAVATGSPWMPWHGTEWLAVAGMVIGPQLVGHFLIQTVLSDIPPVIVSTAVLTEPLLASMLAFGFLGQLPATGLYVTAPLVLLGVAIAVTGARDATTPMEGIHVEPVG